MYVEDEHGDVILDTGIRDNNNYRRVWRSVNNNFIKTFTMTFLLSSLEQLRD